jgi:hypothetical protein
MRSDITPTGPIVLPPPDSDPALMLRTLAEMLTSGEPLSMDISFTRRSTAVQLPDLVIFHQWTAALGITETGIIVSETDLGILYSAHARSTDRWSMRLYCHTTPNRRVNV